MSPGTRQLSPKLTAFGGCDDDHTPPQRQAIERAIDALIDVLDQCDGDADLEVGADAEPEGENLLWSAA